ncbi:MAG TPA: porin [Candidatus Hydrogenedens sp.]|nr:porin [Candidatus Hydrogenedens sp.]
MLRIQRIFFIIIFFFLLISTKIYSDEVKVNLSDKETELIQRIETLEKRVQELESILNTYTEKLATATQDNSTTSSPQEEIMPSENMEAVKPKSKPESTSPILIPQWKDRLSLKSEDGSFELQVGGRIQLDWAFFDNDGGLASIFGEEDDGVQFRRARIDFSGKMYDSISYRMEFDFAGDKDMEGRAKFTDVYLGLSDLPYAGNLQIGHFREPFGMEQLTNPNYNTFMENGLNDVFNPKRNVGLMLFNSNLQNRLLWQVGVFKETDDFPSDDDSDDDQGYAVTGRIVGLPWYKENGRKLLHLGLAYSHRNPDGATLRYKTTPECALANTYTDTDRYEGFRITDAVADDVDLFGTEFLLIYGPLSIQAEQAFSYVDTDFSGSREFQGGYVYTSYFLTGENRVYNNKTGILNRVKPKKNFSPKTGGWGAWELGLRYSWIDLDSGMIRGGKEQDWTLGLNWYLNPNTRVFLNYVRANIEHDLYEGDLNILQTRFQIDF